MKLPALLGNYDRRTKQTSKPTDRPTERQTDRRAGHREVSLFKQLNSESNFDSYAYFEQKIYCTYLQFTATQQSLIDGQCDPC